MRRFRFNLQALLTLRQRAEQKALESYASAILARQKTLDQLEAVRHEQTLSWARQRQELADGCSGGALMQWSASDCILTEHIRAAEAAVNQAELLANQRLQSVLLARRNREAVEKHLQRQRQNYNRDLGREEQKAMDDLANRRSVFSLSSSRGNASVYE